MVLIFGQNKRAVSKLNREWEYLPKYNSMGNFKGLPVLIWIEISLNQQRIDNSECQTECKDILFRGKEIGLLGFVYFLFGDIRVFGF